MSYLSLYSQSWKVMLELSCSSVTHRPRTLSTEIQTVSLLSASSFSGSSFFSHIFLPCPFSFIFIIACISMIEPIFHGSPLHPCALCANCPSREHFTAWPGTSGARDFSGSQGWLFSACSTVAFPRPHHRAGSFRQLSSQDGACPKLLLIGV